MVTSGIGAAVARGFALRGTKSIAITDINKDTLEQTKQSILAIDSSIEVFDRAGDVSNESFVDTFMNDVFTRFGRLDYGVNCAGILGSKTIKAVEMTTDAFDHLNNINYRGTWLSSRAQLRNMLKQEPLPEQPKQRGSIVNIASQLGIVARPGAGKSTYFMVVAQLTQIS
jgi:NAD(P)-dependent dehydrogenase (short-subunit alcohol dehydrogenase family)